MNDSTIIVALITGACSIIGVIFTNIASGRQLSAKIENTLTTSQAVMSAKLEDLQNDVEEIKKLASKTPSLEEKVESLRRDVDSLTRRLEDVRKEIEKKGA